MRNWKSVAKWMKGGNESSACELSAFLIICRVNGWKLFDYCNLMLEMEKCVIQLLLLHHAIKLISSTASFLIVITRAAFASLIIDNKLQFFFLYRLTFLFHLIEVLLSIQTSHLVNKSHGPVSFCIF